MSPLAGLRGAIMVQGTTSDAGKSTVACALCRLLRRAGVSVAPFKPQNMALNSAVTVDGGEIGRAQALQALAAGVEPHTDMNPVLLKPQSDTEAQVIVNGHARASLDAAGYHALKPRLLSVVLAAYRRLREAYDVVVVEGAGSPAEVNLREGDIANMGFALPTATPVILVADIDRGGVFAHLAGTLDCLAPRERALVAGFVINRFRGDRNLLAPGVTWLEHRTGRAVLGVLPYLHGLHLDAEDALPRGAAPTQAGPGRLRVAVPVFPRMSNHTDLDALRAHPRVEVILVEPGQVIARVDLVILAGSKSVQADLRFLREQAWDRQIARHVGYGGKVIGLCGGMQMLGRELHDPSGIEGHASSVPGLGLLDLQSTLLPEKQLRRVRGRLAFGDGAAVEGYEIHHGVSDGPALRRPAVLVDGRPDGAISDDGRIMATYVHGLFDSPAACASLLAWAGLEDGPALDLRQLREASLERLADEVNRHLDLSALAAAIRSAARGEARPAHA